MRVNTKAIQGESGHPQDSSINGAGGCPRRSHWVRSFAFNNPPQTATRNHNAITRRGVHGKKKDRTIVTNIKIGCAILLYYLLIIIVV